MIDPDKMTPKQAAYAHTRLLQSQANRAQASALLQNVAAVLLALGVPAWAIVQLVSR